MKWCLRIGMGIGTINIIFIVYMNDVGIRRVNDMSKATQWRGQDFKSGLLLFFLILNSHLTTLWYHDTLDTHTHGSWTS